MEFKTLTGSDLGSLLELYQQLDPKDGLSAEACEAAWKEIEKNPDIRYFGAVEDGKVVSTCYAVIIPNLTRDAGESASSKTSSRTGNTGTAAWLPG